MRGNSGVHRLHHLRLPWHMPTKRPLCLFYQKASGTTVQLDAIGAIRCNDETSHSITQGQSYEGVFTRGSYVDVRAGRHGSEEVAHDLHAGLAPDSALGLVAVPSAPHFQSSTLRVLVICLCPSMMPPCPEMRIAQGHTALESNRWIAGTKCYHQKQRTEVPLWPYQCHIFCRRLGVCWFRCAVWLVKTEQLSSILVKTNHFATHYAGKCFLRCLKRTCVLWKTRWSATKTIKSSTIFVLNGWCWQPTN